MPEGEKLVAVCREWVQKAENDLEAARRILQSGAGFPTDTVCFHTQQCVEKYLKAILVLEGTDFPKTHDLERLIALLPARAQPRLTPEEQGQLTDYATGARYPGWGELPVSEAKEVVKLARRVRNEARGLLPKEALGRRGATGGQARPAAT